MESKVKGSGAREGGGRGEGSEEEAKKETRLVGNDLLSQGVAPTVPSALTNLTAGFGMEPGVPSSLISPNNLVSILC